MPYTYQPGTDGCDETFDVMTPEGDFLVSIHFWERRAGAEADAKLITDALNAQDAITTLLDALNRIGKACRTQANLLSTATQPERDRFIASVFDAWNEVIAPAMEKGDIVMQDYTLMIAEA